MLVHQANLSRQRIEELEVRLSLNNTEIARLQANSTILEEQLQVYYSTILLAKLTINTEPSARIYR